MGIGGVPNNSFFITNTLFVLLYRVPRLSSTAPEWKTVTPDENNLTYLEISSPTKMQLKMNEDFGHRTFWDGLGFLENSNYYHQIRDEL